MNAWIGIIGIVIGTILGGGIAWFNARFQLSHQAERDKKKFVLSKLEEIHELLSDYKHSYQMLTAEMLKRFASEDFAELPELQAIPSEKLKMLVGFYAPELSASFIIVEETGQAYGELIGNHLLGNTGRKEQKKSLGSLLFQSGKIGEACDEMQQEVIHLSKRYL